MKKLIAVTMLLLAAPSADLLAQQRARLNLGGSYHSLAEGHRYWLEERVGLTIWQEPATIIFEVADGRRHPEGENGQSVSADLYMDWSSRLYTLSSVRFSTDSPVFPRLRAYHRFNFKTGPRNSMVFGIGGGYTDYFSSTEASFVVVGLTYYMPRGVTLSYDYHRHFLRSVSEDGYAHIAWLRIRDGWGTGRSSTRLRFSTGRYAYLSKEILLPFPEVGRDTMSFGIEREQWLSPNFGIVLDLNYGDYRARTDLGEDFKKYQAGIRFLRTW